MVDAFKKGEDYMEIFNEKFDEMIDNMIMKSIVSRVVSQYLNAIWDSVDKRINERSEKAAEEYAKAQDKARDVSQMTDEEIARLLSFRRGDWIGGMFGTTSITKKDIDDYRKAAEAEENAAKARLDAASEFTDSDIDYVLSEISEVMPELGEKLKNIIGKYYNFGESSEANLSALQQGIQGITEDTAGALEAITNGISQQCYLQSDLLTQIRDTVQSFDIDVQTSTFAEMLLQLQISNQTQNAIRSIMEGWSSPNGMSVRVEMV
jgi:hypothetical protein